MLQFQYYQYSEEFPRRCAKRTPDLRQARKHGNSAGKAMDQVEFRKQVKETLEHLYDVAYLETHPLLSQFPSSTVDSSLTRAQKLRSLIKDTIEELCPQQGLPAGSPEWRSYLALRYRYIQGMAQAEVENELGISLRQLQRELHKGLDAVAALLWEKRAATPIPAPDEMKDLENELAQWTSSPAACDVRTLINDTVWMLKPILDARGVVCDVHLSVEMAPVWVDATLIRQILFKLMRILIRSVEPGSVSLRTIQEKGETQLVLQGPESATYTTDADWQAVQLLCSHQGIRVVANPMANSAVQFLLALPPASMPRVLVIDDNMAIHQLFERYLTPHHYEVIHATNGQDALELAARDRPDVITLDVMMPNMDGWQVLRNLTANPATAHIPVVICSVLREPELGFSLGAKAYLKKPVDRLELVATLAQLLLPAGRAAAAPPSRPEGN